MSSPAESQGAENASEPSLERRVREVLEMIRPAIQSDGGDLELVDVSAEGVVSVRLHGACVGCPSANMTLQMGIERNLRDRIPEVTGVRAVP
ncbi:MAG: NifU family protein [Phycisphaerales bacterium]|nr:MAG: NifU family protein [Phycisphaerales bacterium]